MKHLFILLALMAWGPISGGELSIGPSDVYAQALQIEKEVNLLKRHQGIKEEKPATEIKAELQPRHVWQKSYSILTKINIFRRRNRLPVITANSLEPVANLDPALVYEQTQRILTEIHILKTRLGILGQVEATTPEAGKRPIDVFNKLNYISQQWDVLNGEEIDPSYVFAEVMRIDEDLNTIFRSLHLEDTTFPPSKTDVQPSDSLEAAHAMVLEIQRLQRRTGIPRTDLSVFLRQGRVLPSDVFNMVGMGLAELQTLKAHLGLRGELTPPAGVYRDTSPADVHQMLRWVTRKLQLIRSL